MPIGDFCIFIFKIYSLLVDATATTVTTVTVTTATTVTDTSATTVADTTANLGGECEPSGVHIHKIQRGSHSSLNQHGSNFKVHIQV